MSVMKSIGIVLGLAVLFFLALPLLMDDSPEELNEKACRERIRLFAKNPTNIQFGRPLMLAMEGGHDQFTWLPSELQMQNGFGAMGGVKAVCEVDRATHEIVDLRLN